MHACRVHLGCMLARYTPVSTLCRTTASHILEKVPPREPSKGCDKQPFTGVWKQPDAMTQHSQQRKLSWILLGSESAPKCLLDVCGSLFNTKFISRLSRFVKAPRQWAAIKENKQCKAKIQTRKGWNICRPTNE